MHGKGCALLAIGGSTRIFRPGNLPIKHKGAKLDQIGDVFA